MLRIALAAAALLAATGAGWAYYLNGNTLHALCGTDRNFLTAYTLGATDAFTTEFEGETKRICVPLTVTSLQISDVYCKYLNDNPTKRDMPGNILVYQMLLNLYRCTR